MDNAFNYRDVQQVQSFQTPNAIQRNNDGHARSTPYSAGRELSSFNAEGTPSSDARMKTRKARITLDENDHLIIMRACVANKSEMTAEGKKTVFWEIIRQALLRETGKDLALPKQVVERAMRDRHFHLEAHPQDRGKPSNDEMTNLTDQWIAHMESIDGADARWKIQPRPVDRRKPSEKNGTPQQETPILPPQLPTAKPQKRPRESSSQHNSFLLETHVSSAPPARALGASAAPAPEAPMVQPDPAISQMDAIFGQPSQGGSYTSLYPPAAKRQRLGEEPGEPQRVIVEGGMSKEDWIEVLGQVKAHDPRIPAIEQKLDNLIDTTRRTHQLLIQLIKNQARRPGQGGSLGVNGNDLNMNVNGDPGVGE